MSELYDVIAVNMETYRVRIMSDSRTLANAEGIVDIAVMRRGVEKEFYSVEDSGKYAEGDEWVGHD